MSHPTIAWLIHSIAVLMAVIGTLGAFVPSIDACGQNLKDGPMVLRTGRATAALEFYDYTTQSDLRQWFQWMVRLEEVLPPRHTLHAHLNEHIELCKGRKCRKLTKVGEYVGSDASEAFYMLSEALGLSEENRDRIAAKSHQGYTIEVASSSDFEAVRHLARRLGSRGGFLHANRGKGRRGTFVFDEGQGGRERYKVFLGVYTSSNGAQRALKKLEARGITGFVRRL